MYICEICKREWTKEDAEENEFFCTRKCNGRLIPKPAAAMPAGDLIDRIPFPVPDRAAKNAYDRIPPDVKRLLASPLYLHVFHETWKGREADFSGITGEDALFEAYLNALEKELPGIGDTLKAIGDDLYDQEIPVWSEDAALKWTQQWMNTNHIESAFQVCTLAPVETLVSASLLMRPTDDETGYQFSHQKICEQVLKRKLEKMWTEIPEIPPVPL